MEELHGKIISASTKHYTNGWGYATMLLTDEPDSPSVNLVGALNNPAIGSSVIVHGQWTHHAQYGKRFEVEELARDMPRDRADVIRWLVTIPGIGPARAKQLVDNYPGEALWNVLREHPDQLVLIGIPKETVEQLAIQAIDMRYVRDINVTGFGLGFTSKEIGVLMRKMFRAELQKAKPEEVEQVLNSLWNRITSNAWILYFDLHFPFSRVDTLAAQWGTTAINAPIRFAAALVEAIKQFARDGDTRVPVKEACSQAEHIILDRGGINFVTADEWVDAIELGIRVDAIVLTDDRFLATASLDRAERLVAQMVKELVAAEKRREEEEAHDDHVVEGSGSRS